MNRNRYLRAAAAALLCIGIGYGLGRQTPVNSRAWAAAAATTPARDSYQFFDTLVDLRSQILHNYVEKVDDEKLLSGAIKGMMAELDPYSNYFTKDELASFDRAVHGQFSGIGAEISQDPSTGAFVIVSPLDDSPALKAGVYAGDRILKINGETTDGLVLKNLLTKVGGEPGTELKLTVLHEGAKSPTELTVTRAVVQIHSVRGFRHAEGGAGGWDFLIEPQHRIAYVRLSNFMENTADELDQALLPLLRDKNGSLKGVILDLRFNPGGQLQAGIDVCKRFLDSGVIVTAGRPDTAKRDFVAEATKEKTYPRVPLVVLINEYSASASEIVAGALKDHRRAVLIGARTFGKGSVQTLVNLDNGNAALKLTTQYYYLPSGKNVMKKKDSKDWGVEPDAAFNIPLTDDENRAVLLARSQSEIIHKALATAPAMAATAAASAPASAPATEAASAPASAPTTTPATAAASAPAATANPLTNATSAGGRAEPADRQLQRALEILIAYQAFGPARDFEADVTTTRPGASASIPASAPAVPPTAPDTQPQPQPDPIIPQ
jgi:carboxyl-terminal processing protease